MRYSGKTTGKAAVALMARLALLFAGLFILALGIAISVKSNLGVSAISSLPYVLSDAFKPTIGVFTIYVNIGFVLMQMLLLRKNYQLRQLLQLPLCVVFGCFIDISCDMIDAHAFPANYGACMALCIASVFVIALGVWLEVSAKLIYVPGEGLAVAVYQALKIKKFGNAKIIVDVALLVAALAISLGFIRRVVGIREGTFIGAIAVGTVVKLYTRIWRALRANPAA